MSLLPTKKLPWQVVANFSSCVTPDLQIITMAVYKMNPMWLNGKLFLFAIHAKR